MPGAFFALFLAALLLTGCSSGVKEIPPAELVSLEHPLPIETLWQKSLGDGTGGEELSLVAAVADGRVYAAARDGQVAAFDAADGKSLWRVETKAPLAGGPGVGGGLVVVGSSDAYVIALDAESGAERWRNRVSSEVLSVPAVAEGLVVVHTTDGQVFALDAETGERKWSYQHTLPLLTLHGVSSPVISEGAALVGLAGGKLVSLDLDDGSPRWITEVTAPRGRSELQRIADLDATPVVHDGVVYVAVFQGDVAAVSEATGKVLWRRPLSSHAGLAVDWRAVYVVDDDDNLWALDPGNGAALWKQKRLAHRHLSPPVLNGDDLILGDFEGYLHWLGAESGTLMGRARLGSGRISRRPRVVNGVVYAYNDDGTVGALRAERPDDDTRE